MNLGISEGEFWHFNITRLRPYLIAEELRAEQDNFNAWLSGLYVYNAVSVAMANSFSKGSKAKYMQKPIPLKAESHNHMEERLKAEFGAFAESLKGKLCS